MKRTQGFTLVELMVVVAIIAIIAAIAMPQYSDYVTRSKFAEAHAMLGDARVKLEQRFMDNRSYAGGTIPWACGTNAPLANEFKYFTYSCVGTVATYTVQATGATGTALEGIAFTINESNTKATTVTASTAMANAGYSGNTGCWVTKKSGC